ncbi:MAG: HlyC/CorC family transporter [Phycicoccus sp.]|nr:HlyC/CorC family transporter [Phycicoccus sp.]
MSLPLTLTITAVLLLVNAFFVGAEFAAMAARRSQLEPLAEAGSARARVVLQALENMGSVLATAQVGITVCSVLLGAFSEAALHHALVPAMEFVGLPVALADPIALVVALLIVVYLHVVVGEMIPKNLAISGPDRAALVLVPPLYTVARVFRPLISVMESMAKAIVRLFGIEPRDEASGEITPAEMVHIVEESHREGLVESGQFTRLGAALEFSDKNAADVGVPVAGLVTATVGVTPEGVERLVAKHGFSRYPVCNSDGELIGYLHLKDVLFADDADRSTPVPSRRVRAMTSVRPTDGVETVLQAMQTSGSHLARVVGEDGQVQAVVFLEDVIEELVGTVTDASQRS